jgi:hypothetical protein
MNPRIRILLGLSLVLLVTGCASEKDKLVGRWVSPMAGGVDMHIELTKDHRMLVEWVKTADGSGRNSNGTYKVDFKQKPPHFDFKLDDRSEIRTILEIVDPNTFAFENINSGDPRPTAMGRYRMVFRRK